MIHTIGEILRDKIKNFSYVNKIAGVVQTAVDKGTDGKVDRFPVACNVIGADCEEVGGRLLDLIPDDTKKSIFYFEDLGGAVFQEKKGDDLEFISRIRLVGWLNLKKLGQTDCGITAKVVAHLITRMESTNQINYTPFTRLTIKVQNQVSKQPTIFSKYTYAQTKAQFLIFPFDYFAIDLIVKYSINKNCVPEFDAGIEDPCENI
jgi:hypothetical protein